MEALGKFCSVEEYSSGQKQDRNRPRSLPFRLAGVGEVMERMRYGLVADGCLRSRRTPMGEASFMSSPVHGWSGSETGQG